MKYNITLNQPIMIQHNLNVTQWCILDIISIAPTWCEPTSKDGEIYFWIARQKIAEELKALDLKPDTIYRIMKKLVELGFLEYVKLGKKDLVRLSKKGKDLFTSTMSEMNPNHYVGNESENNSDLNPTYNTTNTNNKTSIDYDAFLKLWNEYAKTNKKPLVAKLTDSRKSKILLRKKELPKLEDIFKVALLNAGNSSFLSKSNFFNFDWLFANDINIIKVVEGKYKNAETESIVL